VRHLPPKIQAQFLHAFAHALHGVFLFGLVISIIPFVLSLFLKEVPLRTSFESAELVAEEGVGGAGAEAFAHHEPT
jgi:hypothetical protein